MYNGISYAAIEEPAAMATILPDQHSSPGSRRAMPLRTLGEYLIELGGDIAITLENLPNRLIDADDEHLAGALLESGTIGRQDLDKARQVRDTDLLGTIPMFRSLPGEILTNLVLQSAVLDYSPWETIFRQGEIGLSAYVILSGKVNLSYSSASGQETSLAIRSSGDVFGDMSLLADSTRFSTARAVVKSRILAVPKDLFVKLFHTHPVMFKHAVERWYWAIVESRMQSQAFLDQYYSELLSSLSELSCTSSMEIPGRYTVRAGFWDIYRAQPWT
jgi:CRP-like cAMP-binding protein